MTKTSRSILFSLLTLSIVLGFIELSLKAAAFISPAISEIISPGRIPHAIADKKLVHRPNPQLAEHDKHGFRNLSVPSKVDIVALGDSQTYGVGVATEEAWPVQLASISKKTTYSMAYGGYGPTHSLTLMDEAAALNPDLYIEAFYAGNDLYDAFNLVYNEHRWPELMTADAHQRKRITDLEQALSIRSYVSKIYRMGNSTTPTKTSSLPTETFSWSIVHEFLGYHSRLYSLVIQAQRALLRSLQDPYPENLDPWETALLFAANNAEYTDVFDNQQFKTIFTPRYRLAATDLDDPQIAEGLAISLKSMRRMQLHAQKRNKQFTVLLIPTKERVFSSIVTQPSTYFLKLMVKEQAIWQKTKHYLSKNKIDYIDALPALQDALNNGIQPDFDGHPNTRGHKAIAELVHAQLSQIPASRLSSPSLPENH